MQFIDISKLKVNNGIIVNSAANLDMVNRIDSLVEELNVARDAYYNKNIEVMSNAEYDSKFDELERLEKETGIIRPNSPTQNVGAELNVDNVEVDSNGYNECYEQGKKITHKHNALSLGKTKDVEDLKNFLGNQEGVLSVKMDGLTEVLTYYNGKLACAATRGNGSIGECNTLSMQNAYGVPASIPYKGLLEIRGEAYINYNDFNKINEAVADVDSKYKNPRNLASGTVRTFDNPKLTAERCVHFCCFEIVNWKQLGLTLYTDCMKFLQQQGFCDIVMHGPCDIENVEDAVEYVTETIRGSIIPADGLVLRLNDLNYGDSLGNTARTPRHSIAFKWQDTAVETELIDIEWGVGRTGVITPVAIFKEIEIEGSNVSRASLHNISVMKQLLGRPYVGQKIWVYKANMIIPTVLKAEKAV